MIFIHIAYYSDARSCTQGGGYCRKYRDSDVMILGIRNKLRFLP